MVLTFMHNINNVFNIKNNKYILINNYWILCASKLLLIKNNFRIKFQNLLIYFIITFSK